MNAAATFEIGSNLWNARLYSCLAMASELSASLDQPSLVGSAPLNPRLNRQLDRLNRSVDEMLKAADEAIERQSPDPFPQSLTSDGFCALRDFVLRLHFLCAGLLSFQGAASGNSLRQNRTARLESNNERLLDLADWLDAMSTPEETSAKFEAALEALAKGDVIPWAAVK
jgi:hypothetical protein